MALLTKPKRINVRIKEANGKKYELHLEDIVYMEIRDMMKEETNKCVFMINLDG